MSPLQQLLPVAVPENAMLRFFAKRFYWIVFLWPVVLLALFAVSCFPAVLADRQALVNSRGLVLIFVGLSSGTAFGLGLLLTLARRRAGLSAWFLGWFCGLAVVQTLAYIVIAGWFFFASVAGDSAEFLGQETPALAQFGLLIGLGAGLAAANGGLLGLVVSRWLFCTGRWETTGRPIDRPQNG
jgi:hypothetical protein